MNAYICSLPAPGGYQYFLAVARGGNVSQKRLKYKFIRNEKGEMMVDKTRKMYPNITTSGQWQRSVNALYERARRACQRVEAAHKATPVLLKELIEIEVRFFILGDIGRKLGLDPEDAEMYLEISDVHMANAIGKIESLWPDYNKIWKQRLKQTLT